MLFAKSQKGGPQRHTLQLLVPPALLGVGVEGVDTLDLIVKEADPPGMFHSGTVEIHDIPPDRNLPRFADQIDEVIAPAVEQILELR